MMSERTDKHCTGCNTTKPIEAFARNRVMKDGRGNWCKACCQRLQGRPEYRVRRMEKRRRDPVHELLILARARAKKAGLAFDLHPHDLVLAAHCPVLGIPLIQSSKLTDNTPTLDRYDPAKGYVSGNVIIVSWLANRVKSNHTDPEIFEQVARYLRGVRIVCWESDDNPHGVHAQSVAVIHPCQHEALERLGLSSPLRQDGAGGQ
jgi:hypothetical protein